MGSHSRWVAHLAIEGKGPTPTESSGAPHPTYNSLMNNLSTGSGFPRLPSLKCVIFHKKNFSHSPLAGTPLKEVKGILTLSFFNSGSFQGAAVDLSLFAARLFHFWFHFWHQLWFQGGKGAPGAFGCSYVAGLPSAHASFECMSPQGLTLRTRVFPFLVPVVDPYVSFPENLAECLKEQRNSIIWSMLHYLVHCRQQPEAEGEEQGELEAEEIWRKAGGRGRWPESSTLTVSSPNKCRRQALTTGDIILSNREMTFKRSLQKKCPWWKAHQNQNQKCCTSTISRKSQMMHAILTSCCAGPSALTKTLQWMISWPCNIKFLYFLMSGNLFKQMPPLHRKLSPWNKFTLHV